MSIIELSTNNPFLEAEPSYNSRLEWMYNLLSTIKHSGGKITPEMLDIISETYRIDASDLSTLL